MYRVAATFGWLCVETLSYPLEVVAQYPQPPSGGCVLKHKKKLGEIVNESSHLRVAVC